MILYSDVVLDATFESLRSGENVLGNLFADILREYGETDISLLHGGFVRTNCVQPTGFMSLNLLQKMLEFDDLAVTVELTGAQVLKALENGVSRVESNDGRFLHPSGLTYYFNCDDSKGYRISNVLIKKFNEDKTKSTFEDVQPDKVYSCILPSYIANGGDGFTFLKALPWKVPAYACRRIKFIILEYFQNRIKPVTAQAELMAEDFESIDNKVDQRIVRVHSVPAAIADGDDVSFADDGSVQTSTAICQEDDGGASVLGESSVTADEHVKPEGIQEKEEAAQREISAEDN